MKKFLFFVCINIALVSNVLARPVSYPGGVTLMQTNDMDTSAIHIHYSPTFRYSVGYRGEWWRDAEWQFHGVQFNYLVRRWNQPASQANLHFKSGLGLAHSTLDNLDDRNEAAGFAGFAMDWEDRRYFTSYENRYTEAGEIAHGFTQKARVGIAPYIGDYGDLHTWLMLQVDHNPTNDDKTTLTPLVRFFKNEYLVELGSSDKGDALFNMIIRF